jgi:hypothetical protein
VRLIAYRYAARARLERVFPAHYGERRTISEGYRNFCSLM